MQRIVILGAGTGGTVAANRLRAECGRDVEIVVVDRDDDHVYQPGLLYVAFGMQEPRELVRPRRGQLRDGIAFRVADVDRVETDRNAVVLADGERLGYDVLVVATGIRLLPEETEGLAGHPRAFDFYTRAGAARVRDALRAFTGGRIVVNPIEMPIKCPVAPLEFCFLADWHFRERGLRDRVELTYATTLDGAFTRPLAAAHLGGMLAAKDIAVAAEFATGRVEDDALVSWDERRIPFDLLVTVPVHGGAAFVERSPGLGDELGFVTVDPHTLQSTAADNVFAFGDAANLPTSKAGSGAHFQADALVANVRHALAGDPPDAVYDGHVECFVETGFDRALLIDFDYEREPRRFRETRLNHLGKRLFEHAYWHLLLPGRLKGAHR
jgi:sulfide:quinone oxidoreductase